MHTVHTAFIAHTTHAYIWYIYICMHTIVLMNIRHVKFFSACSSCLQLVLCMVGLLVLSVSRAKYIHQGLVAAALTLVSSVVVIGVPRDDGPFLITNLLPHLNVEVRCTPFGHFQRPGGGCLSTTPTTTVTEASTTIAQSVPVACFQQS